MKNMQAGNSSIRNIIIGASAISVAAILWGLDGVVLTPRLFSLDVGFVVLVLHALPFVLMQPFLWKSWKKSAQFSRKQWIVLFLIALAGGAAGTLAIVKALFLVNFQHLTIVVLLQKLQPVFAISLAALFLKEKLRQNFLLWAALAIISGYFMTFGLKLPNLDSGANTVYAALFALLAAFSFGSSTVLSKKALEGIAFQTATFWRYGLTSLIMLVYVLIIGGFSSIADVNSNHMLIFLIIGLTTGSGAIFLYYFGLNKVKAIVATICELFFPISAIIFDYFFNQVKLGTVQWIAAIIMIFSIVNLNLGNIRARKKSK